MLKQFKKNLTQSIDKLFESKIKKLKEEYEKNYYIEQATINRNNDNISIELSLNISHDPKQDIIRLFEYGGVIKNGEEIIEIEPGYYIYKYFLNY